MKLNELDFPVLNGTFGCKSLYCARVLCCPAACALISAVVLYRIITNLQYSKLQTNRREEKGNCTSRITLRYTKTSNSLIRKFPFHIFRCLYLRNVVFLKAKKEKNIGGTRSATKLN